MVIVRRSLSVAEANKAKVSAILKVIFDNFLFELFDHW